MTLREQYSDLQSNTIHHPAEMSVRIIGIDPGQSGGIAVVGYDTAVWKMPETERDIYDLLYAHIKGPAATWAYLEEVHAFPGQGISSTWKFAQNYGFLRGCLIALMVPFETVTPSKWQQAMKCLSKGNKNVTKRRAQELFPQLRITHSTADALLIAEYGRRVKVSEL